MEFHREVRCEAGYDHIRFVCSSASPRCFPGSGGSHGRHGLQIRWILKGDDGAVQFLLMTGWTPVPSDWDNSDQMAPLPADLGYHSKRPMFEGHKTQGPCDFIGGGECYYDGSGLNASDAFTVLCNEGSDGLWVFLESYYETVFDGVPYPSAAPYKWDRRSERRGNKA